jgi:hypothetical protein
MAVFVVDALVALARCFEDEATKWTEEFLERLRQGDRIIVPAHWATEVANAEGPYGRWAYTIVKKTTDVTRAVTHAAESRAEELVRPK